MAVPRPAALCFTGIFLALIAGTSCVEPSSILQLERLGQFKNTIASSEIIPDTSRLVAQCPKATALPGLAVKTKWTSLSARLTYIVSEIRNEGPRNEIGSSYSHAPLLMSALRNSNMLTPHTAIVYKVPRLGVFKVRGSPPHTAV
jgi:hypothetical protein